MCSNLLVLPDVIILSLRSSHERPELRLFFFSHIKKSGSDRREQPLVKTRPVVIGSELVTREREMRERMRAVDENFDSARLREVDELPDRHYLPSEIRNVRNLDDLRVRRDCRLELVNDVLL